MVCLLKKPAAPRKAVPCQMITMLKCWSHSLKRWCSRRHVRCSFFFSSSQFNEIDHILLAGGNANIPGLAKLLQQKLGYRVTIANPFLQMGFSSKIDIKRIESDASSLMVACGLALRSFD